MKRFRVCAALAAPVLLAIPAWAQTGGSVAFATDVAPILEQHCVVCHHAGQKLGNLDVTSRGALLAAKAVIAGQPDSSPLYTLAALPSDRPRAMPPGGPRLSGEQLGVLKGWIERGAEWPANIALKTPAAGKPPDSDDPREVVRRIHERILAHHTGQVRQSTQAAGDAKPYKVTVPNTTVSYEMVPIPAGEFVMGSPASDPARRPDEQPAHVVRVDAFWMQAHEVTWDEYRLFMFANQAGETDNPDGIVDAVSRPTRPYVEMSFGMGINGFPAISMTQHAANQYAQWLSAKTGEFYRLPTEAEWEYACRAGTTTPYFFGNDSTQAAEFAWYQANSEGKYQQAAAKKPNPWGLYDIAGNVMEWTLDQYAPYKAGKTENPWLKASQPYPHAVRGGSWHDDAGMLRCAARAPSDASWKQQDPQLPKSIWYHTDAQWLGFRLARPAKLPTADEMYDYWNSGVEEDDF
jgi:formylglycine-generating enzyme required for sulfatase activity